MAVLVCALRGAARAHFSACGAGCCGSACAASRVLCGAALVLWALAAVGAGFDPLSAASPGRHGATLQPLEAIAPASPLLVPPHNLTIFVPCAGIAPWGYGNLVLPSGRRVHAYRNVFQATMVQEQEPPGQFFTWACKGWLGVRTDRAAEPELRLDAQGARLVAARGGWDEAAPTEGSAHVLFAIDTENDGAFIHWVAESAVHLVLWAEIKALYPGAKLLLRQKKGYKALLLPVFGIDAADVMYTPQLVARPAPAADGSGSHLLSPVDFPLPNMVLLPPFTLFIDRDANVPAFVERYDALFERLRAYAGLGAGPPVTPSPVRAARILVLPRGSKENFVGNDRKNQELEVLARLVATGRYPHAAVLRTDTVTDIREQVRAVAGARVLFLDGASAAYFNSAIARNATIHATGYVNHPYLAEQHTVLFKLNTAAWAYGARSNTLVEHLETLSEPMLQRLLEDAEALVAAESE
jgi:hypothetical protein